MNHGVKKLKLNYGKDANRALVRKLLISFFTHGHLKTTHVRAKILKSKIDSFIDLAKKTENGAYNKLLSLLPDKKMIEHVKSVIAPQLSGKVGGYVRLVKYVQRISDGAHVSEVQWAQPMTTSEFIQKTATK
jgi:large subunit ribosomal protein L17